MSSATALLPLFSRSLPRAYSKLPPVAARRGSLLSTSYTAPLYVKSRNIHTPPSSKISEIAWFNNKKGTSKGFSDFYIYALLAGSAVLGIEFLRYQANPIEAKEEDTPSNSELCLLVLQNDINGVKKLLRKYPETDINDRHPLGWTALLVASANSNAEMVKLLLDLGAQPNLGDEFRVSRKSRSYQEIRNSLLQREREFCTMIYPTAPTQGFTALHYACVQGNIEIIDLLLQAGADPRVVDDLGHAAKEYLDEDGGDYAEVLQKMAYYEDKLVTEQKKKEKELRKKYPLEQRLKEVIVGQESPINSVASAIRRKENGWYDEDRPLVFLFLGSSGVGKTELAKQVARYLHKDSRESFIRIDMSEFQSKHEVAKFIGSPPGYVGYEEGGQLTEKLQKCPNAVVLLDEVEKAHPDVLTIMLQVFDEGRLTDGKGSTVTCKDAIFIMTSNLAQTEIADEAEALRNEAHEKSFTAGLNDESTSLSKKFINQTIYPILRSHFQRDEFLGRITETLYFLPFNEQELKEIASKEMQRWAEKAQKRHGIKLVWTPELIDLIARDGYNIRYGARSIKHEIERRVVNQIAKAHELDEVVENSTVKIYTENNTIRLKPMKSDSGKMGLNLGIFGSK
ncbi:hypothetical protein H4219_002166 [Mycoemilia scoparia]|uniref:Caseinolytic peptidase B protein homolog n=1 Tax=Mycoemilia scoparia TaxID=417184 RepID=A0A9W7ZYE1_9FUNG|nr:hypothetical protein H4219_002166 [Mycoemilia scoparia]